VVEAGFVVVDEDRRGDVHGVYKADLVRTTLSCLALAGG
jgi:hypothetical protein